MRRSVTGGPQVYQNKGRLYSVFLALLDFLFSAVVITPAVVGCWRSQWRLMEIFCYPDDPLTSASISTVIGFIGNIFLNLIQQFMDATFHPNKKRVMYYIISRMYSIFYAFVCVNWFKGVWQLLDIFTPADVVTVSITTTFSILILALLRSLRNISSPPLVVASDERSGYFKVLTIFRIASDKKRKLYLLDCIFSTAGVGTLVVSVWRGGFQLLDLLVFPDNKLLSYWTTLVMGYGIVSIAFIFQPIVKWICDNLSIVPRLFFGDIFIIFSCFGTINTWRGMWDLLDFYFLPDQPELSCWIVYWVSLVFLILLGCSNSLLVRGVFIDAEEPGGESMIFPCHFIRNLLAQQREAVNIARLKEIERSWSRDSEEKANVQKLSSKYLHTIQMKECRDQ